MLAAMFGVQEFFLPRWASSELPHPLLSLGSCYYMTLYLKLQFDEPQKKKKKEKPTNAI